MAAAMLNAPPAYRSPANDARHQTEEFVPVPSAVQLVPRRLVIPTWGGGDCHEIAADNEGGPEPSS